MITIFKANSFKCAANYVEEVLKNVDRTDIASMHTVIVPDRASLEAERSLLRNVGGSFNIQIRTFQRFANDVTAQNKYLNKQGGIIALTEIIRKNRGALVCFTKGVDNSGFAESVYEVISMLKYCKIPPEKLYGNLPRGVLSKAADIAFLYKKYIDFMKGEYIDSADKLDMLCEKIYLSDSEKNNSYYFYDFDNFSKQELSVIDALIKSGANVTVACCASYEKKDRHLYLNDICEGVLSICRQNGITPNIVQRNEYISNVAKQTANFLFSYDEPSAPVEAGGYVEIFEGETRVQEVYALACRIQRYVRGGGRFKDVYVVTSDVNKYAGAVTTVFYEFDIPYFCDISYALSDHPYAQFICDYLTMWKSNFKLQSVLCFVKNYFFSQTDDKVNLFENYCLKYNISYDFERFELGTSEETLFAAADSVRQKLVVLTKKITVPAAATVSEYANTVRNLICEAELDLKAESFAQVQAEKGRLFESKVSSQAAEKFAQTLQQTEAIAGGSYVKTEEFLRLFCSALESVSLSVLPVKNDSVVFANMAKARKHDIKFLALLGANYGAMPIIKSDCKLLSDRNISELSLAGVGLEPKIFTENKRERFSLYQLLLEPSKKLFVSYTLSDGKDSLLPSPFVDRLSALFNSNGKQLVKTEKSDEDVFTEKQALSKLILNRRKLADGQIVRMPGFSALYEEFKDKTDRFAFKKAGKDLAVRDGVRLYLGDRETSVSKLTDFYKCPYGFYLRYGLAVRPRRIAKLDASDLGNILHSVLEKFVKDLDLKEPSGQTREHAEKYFAQVLSDDFYRGISNSPAMRNALSQLKKEAVRMCEVVKEQIICSEFKPIAAELSFGSKGTLKPVEVRFDKGSFFLVGKIDRVDVFEDKFVVIDYKSGAGASDFSEADLYVGHKLQLPVYVRAVAENMKLSPAGFYYFNMHNNFTDVKTDKVYVYKGRTLFDKDIACALDKNLLNGKSEKLALSLNKDGGLKNYGKKLVSRSELEAESDYALALIRRAGELMSEGYAAVSPYDGACEYCDYVGVCDYGDVFVYPPRKLSVKVEAENLSEAVKKS